MLKALATIALLSLGIPSTALAADLVADPPADALPSLVSDPGWGLYVQGYGGIVTQGQLLGVDHFPGLDESFSDLLTSGPAFGASIGVTTPIDGLSLGVDVMHTHADLTTEPGESLDSLSIMGTVEGAYHLNLMFDIYASGGLGAIQYRYRDGDEDVNSTFAPAYQVAVGVRANVTENFSIFAEARHQDLISGADIADIGVRTATSSTITSTATNALLAGVRFQF